jgi:hypothetical protein
MTSPSHKRRRTRQATTTVAEPVDMPARLPSEMHLRRLTVLREAGIDQKHLAGMIDPPKSRQAVGQVIWDTFRSPMAGARIAEGIVKVLQDRFRALGKAKRAEQITMAYLGWDTPEDVAMSKRADDHEA